MIHDHDARYHDGHCIMQSYPHIIMTDDYHYNDYPYHDNNLDRDNDHR